MSEVNATEVVIEANETKQAGSAVSAKPQTEAVALAQAVANATLSAEQVRREEIRKEAARKAAYLEAHLPVAEVYEHKSKLVVYIPFDIRSDIYNWQSDAEIVSWSNMRLGNEFDFIEEPARFTALKNKVILRGIDLFKQKEALQQYINDTDDEEKIGVRAKTEIKKVIDKLDELFGPLMESVTTATAESEFTFDELSLVLGHEGTKFVIIGDDGVELALTAKKAECMVGFFGPFIEATGEVYVCNPELTKYEHTYYFSGFTGKKKLKELGIYPLDTNAELQVRMKARGEKYIAVTSNPSYYAYKGDLVRKMWRMERRFRATGRAMIDFSSMEEMDPNYSNYFGGRADDSNRKGYKAKDTVQMSDDVLMTTSPYVYGFSFVSKAWGEMLVENLTAIDFREDAYEKLVMETNQKQMILSLVETQLQGQRSDLIDGKGGGCIFLLAGEPGTGKTLTAEVTAEKLKRPLYMVGVGELGTTADELEINLRQILDIAAKWNAVLLLDECDIFMEARTDSNIQRNAMVGVFLRLLEYYPGILFLTSNRAANIDKAFYSRISMAINFPSLATEDRIMIWSNILGMHQNQSIDAEDILWLADSYDINGRQIKNAVRNAFALARHDNREVQVDDFTLVLDKGIEFQEAVFARGATNDMRLTGMHHDNPDDEEIHPASYYLGEEEGFFSRIFRAVGGFFNILGGAK